MSWAVRAQTVIPLSGINDSSSNTTVQGTNNTSPGTTLNGVNTTGSTVNPNGANTTSGNVNLNGVNNTPSTSNTAFSLTNPLSPQFNSVGGLISSALQIFSYIAVLVAVLLLIWVGFRFVLSQGNTEKMKELKNWLLWIVVGVAVVIGARIIVSVVISTLDATGVVSPNVIQNAKQAAQIQ